MMNLQIGSFVAQRGKCEHVTALEERGCWHKGTTLRRVFSNGRLLLENRFGFVHAFDPSEVTLDK